MNNTHNNATTETVEIPTLQSTYKGFKNDASHNMNNMDEWRSTLTYDGRKFTFPFFMGTGHNKQEPTLYDVLNSLFIDAFCGLQNETVQDLMDDFGYEDRRQASKILKQCKEIAQSLLFLFQVTEDELETLKEQFQEMGLLD